MARVAVGWAALVVVGCGDASTGDVVCPGDGQVADGACAAARCGDGVVDSGEACDDGVDNGLDADACRPDCTLPVCGDGVVDSGEACDDGEPSAARRGGLGAPCSSPYGCEVGLICGAGTCTAGEAGDPCSQDGQCGVDAPICMGGVCATTRCPATPGPEVCDGIDNDCDGIVDNGCAVSCERDDRPVVNRQASCSLTCSSEPDELFVPCGAVIILGGAQEWAGPVLIEGRVRAALGATPLSFSAEEIIVSGVLDGRGRGPTVSGSASPGTAGGGGAYGGAGGRGGRAAATSSSPYGTASGRTIEAGSSGDHAGGAGGGAGGGRGGAAFRLTAPHITIGGLIDASGNDGLTPTLWAARGGSGGGILIESSESDDLTGARLWATGGAGGSESWSGGGGRVKVFRASGVNHGVPDVRVTGGAGGQSSSFSGTSGGAGTVLIED